VTAAPVAADHDTVYQDGSCGYAGPSPPFTLPAAMHSSSRPGSAPCAIMAPLAGWQAKLAELEAACRNAEQLMLMAPTRSERSAALDLAGEVA
jgi:hypothetical protein